MKSLSAFSLVLCAVLLLASCVPLSGSLPAPTQPAPSTALPSAEAAPAATPVQAEATAPPTNAGLANPASVNCIDQGGSLSIEKRGDGGEFGVCTFEDNRQCEEWALLRGHCVVGGIKVTGFVTPAARYCAITGGAYAPTGNVGGEDEQGVCTLPNGVECDVWDYYDGKCSA
jgi:hypothetical protein